MFLKIADAALKYLPATSVRVAAGQKSRSSRVYSTAEEISKLKFNLGPDCRGAIARMRQKEGSSVRPANYPRHVFIGETGKLRERERLLPMSVVVITNRRDTCEPAAIVGVVGTRESRPGCREWVEGKKGGRKARIPDKEAAERVGGRKRKISRGRSIKHKQRGRRDSA